MPTIRLGPRPAPAGPPPDPAAGYDTLPELDRPTCHTSDWVLGLILPIVGIAIGLVQAFDPDPLVRQRAGYSFSGAAVGAFILALIPPIVSWYIWTSAFVHAFAPVTPDLLK